MTYRFDHRSPKQFKKDIKDCTAIERVLMQVYVDWLNNGGGKRPAGSYSFIDNGVDNTGAFIADHKKVHCAADFILKTVGGRDKKIEIKFCRPDKPEFHLKVNQVTRYIEDDVCLINFMGIEGKNPMFCVITPAGLKKIAANNPTVKYKPYGYKLSYNVQNTEMKYIHVTIPN